MNVHVVLSRRNVKPWYTEGGVSVCGHGFLPDGTLISQERLTHYLSTAKASEIDSKLRDVNGFFACVVTNSDKLVLAVDRIRSIPLFYGIRDNHVFVSDDAEHVRREVDDVTADEVSKEEFLLTGYVTGADTLYPNVKQVQAGEMIDVSPDESGNMIVTPTRWYRFVHDEPPRWDEDDLRQELNRRTLSVHRRLVEYAAGRQVVIPLSGGYDSRLTATILKQMGYKNVISFTYGIEGNVEARVSEQVAKKLGLRWHFVEYSETLWCHWYGSKEKKAFVPVGSGWSSVPHMQDWPAIQELMSQGVLDRDAVIVPGHSGDFVAGSHLWGFDLSAGGGQTKKELVHAIMKKHYCLRRWSSRAIHLENWSQRILSNIKDPNVSTAVELANRFEEWDWQERQAKFVVNSVRVYDFWGFDWWMPLWDVGFLTFWEQVPLQLRLNRKWYPAFVQSHYRVFDSQAFQPESAVENHRFFRKFVRQALPVGVLIFLRSIREKRNYRKETRNRRNHPMAWYGWIDDQRLREGLKSGGNINSFISEDIVALIAANGQHHGLIRN